MNEIVVMYDEELCKINIINKCAKCLLLERKIFSIVISSINYNSHNILEDSKYIGIVYSNIIGLIDIDNTMKSHLFTLSACNTYDEYNNKICNYGGIAFNHQYPTSSAFFFSNSKLKLFYYGYFKYENNHLKINNVTNFSYSKLSNQNIDTNAKIYLDSKNCIYLISSNLLAYICGVNLLQENVLIYNTNIDPNDGREKPIRNLGIVINNSFQTLYSAFSILHNESRIFNVLKEKLYLDDNNQKSCGNFIFERLYRKYYTENASNFESISTELNINRSTYQLSIVDFKGSSVIPKYHIEKTKNKCDGFEYDQSPVVKFITSSQQFSLNFLDFICAIGDFNAAIKIEITDLDHNNQDWIQVDHSKSALTILDIKEKPKSVLISFTTAIIYSFKLEVSYGICSLSNCTTCKLSSYAAQEECFDGNIVDSSESKNISKEIKNIINIEHDYMLFMKWILLIFIIILFLFVILKIIYYCIRYKCCTYLSKIIPKNSSIPQTETTNEMVVIGTRIDSPEFRITSFQSSIRNQAETN